MSNALLIAWKNLNSFFMKNSTLLKAGLIGTIISALCCFTPILVVVLGAVGLSSILGWLDYVLLPALVFFVLLLTYALFRRKSFPKND